VYVEPGRAAQEGDGSMKRLATIIMIVVVFSLIASSPLPASPSSRIHSLESFMAFMYRYIAPSVFGIFSPAGIQPIDSGGREGLRGDADDAANGRDDNTDKDKRSDNRITAGLPDDDPDIGLRNSISTYGRR
jgi:hypothetical protein